MRIVNHTRTKPSATLVDFLACFFLLTYTIICVGHLSDYSHVECEEERSRASATSKGMRAYFPLSHYAFWLLVILNFIALLACTSICTHFDFFIIP